MINFRKKSSFWPLICSRFNIRVKIHSFFFFKSKNWFDKLQFFDMRVQNTIKLRFSVYHVYVDNISDQMKLDVPFTIPLPSSVHCGLLYNICRYYVAVTRCWFGCGYFDRHWCVLVFRRMLRVLIKTENHNRLLYTNFLRHSSSHSWC